MKMKAYLGIDGYDETCDVENISFDADATWVTCTRSNGDKIITPNAELIIIL